MSELPKVEVEEKAENTEFENLEMMQRYGVEREGDRYVVKNYKGKKLFKNYEAALHYAIQYAEMAGKNLDN